MRELLRSHSISYLEGLRIALDAHGIETVLFDQQMVGFVGFAGRVRLMVQHDADFERARSIVQGLESSASAPQPVAGWKLQRWGCVAATVGIIGLGFAGAALRDLSMRSLAPSLVAYGLFGLALVVIGIGLALILFGPRWAHRDPPS